MTILASTCTRGKFRLGKALSLLGKRVGVHPRLTGETNEVRFGGRLDRGCLVFGPRAGGSASSAPTDRIDRRGGTAGYDERAKVPAKCDDSTVRYMVKHVH